MTTTNGRYPAAAVTTVGAVLTVPADLGGGSGAALAGEVLGRLRALELIAAGAPSSPATAARVRAELFEQTALWRRLLGEHCLAEDGDGCPRCRSWHRPRSQATARRQCWFVVMAAFVTAAHVCLRIRQMRQYYRVMKRLLMIFAKQPQVGCSKTRLAADVGLGAADVLYRAFLTDVAYRAYQLQERLGVHVRWVHSPSGPSFAEVMDALAPASLPRSSDTTLKTSPGSNTISSYYRAVDLNADDGLCGAN